LNSVVSLYYYMHVVKAMYLDDPGEGAPEPIRVPWHTVLILLLAVPTVIFGVRFGLLDRLSAYSIRIFGGS
jgi:NADH:ubiquinone oxidoreductase subunit 2 (subunit N)